MVSASFTAFKANDPYELLIQQILTVESQPRFDILDKQDVQTRKKDALGTLDSNVSALDTLMTSFTDLFANPFDARTATVPENSSFGVTATDDAPQGSHSLQVLRLAGTDTRLSQQYTSTGTSLRSFFDTNGSQTFQINVASPTDLDPLNRVDVAVTVNPTGATDQDIMQEISDAINTAMDDAATAGTIKSTETASSSVVNETSDTTRLSLRSSLTGFENRLQFTDSAGGLLAALDVTNTAIASGTAGGQVTAVGTSELDSMLNSQFTLDGLTMYRSTNQVSDALTGLTLDLKQADTIPTDFSVGTDTDSIKTQLNDFIAKFNDILTFVEGQTQVDGDLGIRADFAGDSLMTGLRFGLRADIAQQVTGQPVGAVTLLSEIGITSNDDGTLELTDTDKLTEALGADPGAVKSLFASSDGFASRIKTRLEAYTGINGLISDRTDVTDDRISRLDDRLATFDERMLKREDQLRAQFASLQQAMALFQGQQQFFGSIFG